MVSDQIYLDKWYLECNLVSQTSFGHISINSSKILIVLMASKSPWKDLLIDTSHVSRQSMMTKISGRSTGNYYSIIYQIADILETAMINAFLLGIRKALLILLKMSLKKHWDNWYSWRYEGLNVCIWTSLITYK